jgi:hypothetical protein
VGVLFRRKVRIAQQDLLSRLIPQQNCPQCRENTRGRCRGGGCCAHRSPSSDIRIYIRLLMYVYAYTHIYIYAYSCMYTLLSLYRFIINKQSKNEILKIWVDKIDNSADVWGVSWRMLTPQLEASYTRRSKDERAGSSDVWNVSWRMLTIILETSYTRHKKHERGGSVEKSHRFPLIITLSPLHPTQIQRRFSSRNCARPKPQRLENPKIYFTE